MKDHNELDAVIRAARYTPDPEPILRLAETFLGSRRDWGTEAVEWTPDEWLGGVAELFPHEEPS